MTCSHVLHKVIYSFTCIYGLAGKQVPIRGGATCCSGCSSEFLKNMLEFLKKCKKKNYVYILNTLGWDPEHPASFFSSSSSSSPLLRAFFFSAVCPIFLLSFIAQTHLFLFLFLCFICLFGLWLMSLHVRNLIFEKSWK